MDYFAERGRRWGGRAGPQLERGIKVFNRSSNGCDLYVMEDLSLELGGEARPQHGLGLARKAFWSVP